MPKSIASKRPKKRTRTRTLHRPRIASALSMRFPTVFHLSRCHHPHQKTFTGPPFHLVITALIAEANRSLPNLFHNPPCPRVPHPQNKNGLVRVQTPPLDPPLSPLIHLSHPNPLPAPFSPLPPSQTTTPLHPKAQIHRRPHLFLQTTQTLSHPPVRAFVPVVANPTPIVSLTAHASVFLKL